MAAPTGSTYYQQGVGNVQSAAGSGQSAINSFDPSSFATNTMSGLNSITNNQNATQNDYLNAFKQQIASQPSATQYYQQGMQQFNVPQLQKTANNAENAVLTAPINDVNAAKGFNYDNSQVEQKQNQDLEYLQPAASAAENNAQTAETNAMNYANNGIQQNQMNILPIQEQGQYLMQQYAAQMTGWTTAQAQQLSALQDKMDQGVALSQTEMQQYTTLTQSEQNYQAALTQANATVQAAQVGANATTNAATIGQTYKTLTPNQEVYNTQTGAIQPY